MSNPIDKGFYMPAEWSRHECTWMAWPVRKNMWRDEKATRENYALVANTIAEFEPVKMLMPAAYIDEALTLLSASVQVIEMPIDDSWARDSGPNFLVNDHGELAGSCWGFNAWGEKYDPYDQDALMGERIVALANAELYESKLIAEGGGVTVDGEGTVITTDTCFLHENRNPNWNKNEVDAELCRSLGASKVIWLPGDEEEVETNGHVDGIAAFVRPGLVLVEVGKDQADPYFDNGELNRRALEGQYDASGREIEIRTICTGDYNKVESDKDCRSYINSYLPNGAVIVPGYEDTRDAWAVETYRELYPEREVVQVPILAIAEGGGGIHCITQQQPQSPASQT